MKKWFAGLLIIVVIFLVLIYALIPSTIRIANTGFVKSNVNAVYRTMVRQELWDKWAPGQFRITKILSNGFNIDAMYAGKTTPGQVLVIPLRDDSSAISWQTELPPAVGPLARLSGYFHARSLKNQMSDALQQFTKFCVSDSNVYGLNIRQTSTKDTFLVATKFTSLHYPSQQEIYGHVNKLRKFVAEHNLAETGSPMLNTTTADSIEYHCMAAIPINEITKGQDDVFFVRMIPGRFLTTELKGGPVTIRQAHETMQQYFRDYKRTSMAIPFEYLVTDRIVEKDTNSWVTKLYYPVY